MKIYLATWMLEDHQGIVLTKIGKRERLLSYFHIKKEKFKKYIIKGK